MRQRTLADVTTIVHAGPRNFLYAFIGRRNRALDSSTGGCNTKDPSAFRNILMIGEGSPCMEDDATFPVAQGFQPGGYTAGFVFSWVTTRGENHTNCWTFVPRERHLGEPLVYNSLYGLNQIRSQSE